MSSGGDSPSALHLQELRFRFPEQLHLQPKHALQQQQQRQQQQERLQYPREGPQDAQSRQAQQQQLLQQKQEDQHLQQQQQQFLKKRTEASQEQHQPQEEWQTKQRWQVQQQTCGVLQGQLPASPKQRQQHPSHLQWQQHSSLMLPEPWGNKMLFSGEGLAAAPALRQHQGEQQLQLSWQQQLQVEKWRSQQEKAERMSQPDHQQQQCQPQHQSPLNAVVGQQHTWEEPERMHFSASLQERQRSTVTQQHQRMLYGQGFSSVQNYQPQEASERHIQKQRQPEVSICMPRASRDHIAKPQQQQPSKTQQQPSNMEQKPRETQQQQRSGKWQQQQRQQDFDVEQQQHQDKACPDPHFLAAADASRTKEAAGQRRQQCAADVAPAANVSEAHSPGRDWAAFARPKQQQQQQQHQENETKQRQPPEQCLVVLQQQHHLREPMEQKQLPLELRPMQPLLLMESYERQQPVLGRQATLKQQLALQQQPASQRQIVEPLFDKNIFAAAAASASSGGSGESPVSPRNIPVATVVVLDSQGEYSSQQKQHQMNKQLLQQDVQTQQAYLFSEQQQKLQVQPLLLEKEQQTQLQQELHGERLQLHIETVQLQQEQHPQQHRQEQQLDQQQKMVGNRCTVLELFDQLGTANSGMPSRAAVASEQCEEVRLLSTADSLTTPAGDVKLLGGSDSWICWDSSSRRSSLYTEHKSQAPAEAVMTFSSVVMEKNLDQNVSRCRYSSTYNNSSSECRDSDGYEHQRHSSISSNDSRGSPVCSSDVSGGCSGRKGRIKSRYGSSEPPSREAWKGSHSAATPCMDALLSKSPSAFAACLASAEAAGQPDGSFTHSTPKFAADPSSGSRRGCGGLTEVPCELLSGEKTVQSSRNSSSRSRNCSQSSGWQSWVTKSRNGFCERNSNKCEISQSNNCSEDIEVNQCCSSRRCHTRWCRNSRTSGHSNNASFVSCRRRKRSSSHRNTQHSPSSGSSRNSRRGDSDIEKRNISHVLSGTRRSCSHSESHSSSPGEDCELLAYDDNISGRTKGGTINKETLNGTRKSNSSRKLRSLRGCRRENNEPKGGSSGVSKKAAIVMRNFNMLVDALAGEADKEGASFASRVTGKVQRQSKLEPQRRRRHQQQEQQEEQQQHQPQQRRQQKQWVQQVQRQSQQSQALLAGRGSSYNPEGVWQNESVALQVLDQHARLTSSQVDSGSSGSSRSSLLKLPSIDSKSSDSSCTGSGAHRSNRGSSKGSCSSDRDHIAGSSSETAGGYQQMKRSKTSSGNPPKGGASCSRGRNRRSTSCNGPGRRTCFAGRRLQDMSPRRKAATARPDTTYKSKWRSSSASQSSGDRRGVTEGVKEIRFGKRSCFENGCPSSPGNFFDAVQQEHPSSSRATDEVMCSTPRRRRTSSHCDSASLKQESDMNSIRRSWNAADTPSTESQFTSKKGLRYRELRNSSCSSRALLTHPQQRKPAYSRFSSEADEEEKKLSRFKCWAIKTLDVLPEAWVGEHVDAVATMRLHGSSTRVGSESNCSYPEVSSGLSLKNSELRMGVRVDRDVAVATTSPATLPATLDVAVGGAPGENRAVRDRVAVARAVAGSPVAVSREFSSAAWDARVSGGAASPAVTGRPEDPATAPAAAAAAETRESAYLLRGYKKGEGAASAAEAKNARQETVKAAIRQQLLQQYSSVLQQLQQHKAAAQLVQDESEPLRAALVHVVAAEAQLRKLQRSERWRLHVGALIHDADEDLMKFMANFGAAAETFPLPLRKRTLLSQDERGRRRNVFSLEEEAVAEDEDEEKGKETDQEEARDQTYNEGASLSCLAWIFTPLLSLLVRDSNSARFNATTANGRKIREKGNEPSTINRSRARLLLRFFLGYILLCGSVFLWLRHTIHQL